MFEIYYAKYGGCETNIEDMLGTYILENISGTKPTYGFPTNDINRNCISMTGSTIEDSDANSILAGVGISTSTCKVRAFKECWAVRGKYTLDIIKETCIKNGYNIDYDDIILGDSSILMPYFYPNYNTTCIQKKYKYGIILHHIDNIVKFKDMILNKDVNFIDPLQPIEKFIDEILLCENIISSSLYGVILGNTYRIPTCWIRMNGTKLPKDDIEFHDYFSAIFEEKQKCFLVDGPIYVWEIPRDYYMVVYDEFTYLQQKLYDKILNKTLALIDKKTNFVHSFDKITHIFDNLFNGKKNFFINRIGGNELDIYVKYIQNKKNMNIINTCDVTQDIKKYAGYYDLNDDPKNLKFFLEKYAEAYTESDIVMVANSALCSAVKYILPTDIYYQNIYNSSFKNIANGLMSDKTCIEFHYIESLNYINKWFGLLNGKRVLIISPFTNEIKRQLDNKHNIFKDVDFQKIDYPEFSNVEYITTPLTMNGYTTPHKNWRETYNHLCRDVRSKKKQFDIALLMCGCYAGPLGLYIKKIYRSAIYLGGIGQLMFGIKGGRYMIPYYTRFMNEHWIYPDISDELKLDNNYCANEGFKAYF